MLKIVCDRCNREITGDMFPQKAAYTISFEAAGDGNNARLDFCRQCFWEVIGRYLPIQEEE